jgi:hypothetical protein
MARTPWWQDALVASLPWLVVPAGVAGFVAWAIARQPALQATAESRIDDMARIVGVFAGAGIAWSFSQGYRRRNEAGNETGRRRPSWALLALGAVGIALGVVAVDSAASYRATSHYNPDSSKWTSFVDGCLKNCRQSSGESPRCGPYCECSAKTFFGTTVVRDVDRVFGAIADGGSMPADVKQQLEDIGKTCAAAIGE